MKDGTVAVAAVDTTKSAAESTAAASSDYMDRI